MDDLIILFVVGLSSAVVIYLLIKYGRKTTSTNFSQQKENKPLDILNKTYALDRYMMKKIFQSTIFLTSTIEGKKLAKKQLGNKSPDEYFEICLKKKEQLDQIKDLIGKDKLRLEWKIILEEIDLFCRQYHESRKDILESLNTYQAYDDAFKPDMGWEKYFKSINL